MVVFGTFVMIIFGFCDFGRYFDRYVCAQGNNKYDADTLFLN